MMKSLRVQLSVFLLASALVVAALIGFFTYRQTLEQNEELFDYQLRQTALSLRDQGVAERLHPDLSPEEALDVVVQIWTMNGTVVYFSHPGTPLPDRATLGFSNIEAGGQRWRVYSMSARNRIIQVAQPLQIRRDLAAAAALRSLSPLLAFVPLMALLVWLLVGRALHPLKRLAREVTQRDVGALGEVSEQGLPSEIAPVAHALNDLLTRLHRAFLGQRAFVADAAHELRSPLTALKLQLQLLDKAGDETSRHAALRELNEGVDRASRLIGQLLTAARTEPGDAAVVHQPVDLAETMRRVIAELFPMAHSRRIDIALDAPDAPGRLMIEGDSDQLQILMRNLVDNAVRYAPEGGVVRASTQRKEHEIILAVEDSGPGIPAADRLQVFQRFYRGQTHGQPGSGLGLAIVKNIADAHHAEVRLSDSALGGLRVDVCFSSA